VAAAGGAPIDARRPGWRPVGGVGLRSPQVQPV